MAELIIVGALSYKEQLAEFLDLHIAKCAITEIADVSADVDNRIVEHFAAADRPIRQADKGAHSNFA